MDNNDTVAVPRREPVDAPPDLLIGRPERALAVAALDEHLTADRIDSAEFERRVAACERARTRSELLSMFADLPAPHPDLPGPSTGESEPEDEDMPPIAAAVTIALLLGLPVTVVLGFVYGAWWTLTIPVAVSVVMIFVHGLTAGRRDRGSDAGGGR